MSTVLVLGTFDLLHPGHVKFLRQAAFYGDKLVVALNTDEFVNAYKRPPIMTYDERAEMLRSLRLVDAVFPNFGGYDSKPAIVHAQKCFPMERLVIVHGDDWTGESYLKQLDVTREWLDQREITIEYVPYTTSISTTDLIRRIKKPPVCKCSGRCVGQGVLDDAARHMHEPERTCREA
jgi:glycerol-3-phosphate cytidylyltransferase